LINETEKTKKLLKALEERLKNGDITQEEYKDLRAKYQARLGYTGTEEEGSEEKSPKQTIPRMVSISGSGRVTDDYISISGSGSVEGWGSGSIKISGSGKISKDEINVSGSAKLSGDFRTGSIKSSGDLKVEGDVQAKNVRSSGSTKIEGDLTVEESAKFSGSLKIEGDIHGKDSELAVSGAAKIEGDIEAKDVSLEGAFRIEGDVTADVLKVEMANDCEIEGMIRARDVNIKQRTSRAHLEVAEIQATGHVYLEGVSAKRVAGEKVEIGPDCDIGEIQEES